MAREKRLDRTDSKSRRGSRSPGYRHCPGNAKRFCGRWQRNIAPADFRKGTLRNLKQVKRFPSGDAGYRSGPIGTKGRPPLTNERSSGARSQRRYARASGHWKLFLPWARSQRRKFPWGTREFNDFRRPEHETGFHRPIDCQRLFLSIP